MRNESGVHAKKGRASPLWRSESDTSSSPEKSLSLFSESGAARTTQDDVNRTRELIRAAEGTKKHLLNPTSQWMKSFDVASTCALVFTAVITPVEVAFFLSEDGTGTPSSPLFWANRVVDLIFVTEMVQTFFLPFKDSNDGNRWVRRHRDIVRHYLRGWFAIDLFSCASLWCWLEQRRGMILRTIAASLHREWCLQVKERYWNVQAKQMNDRDRPL